MKEFNKSLFLQKFNDTKLNVVVDSGANRHLAFTSENSLHSFEITTWHGHLCISSDFGTYVFSGICDMFSLVNVNSKLFSCDDYLLPEVDLNYWKTKIVTPCWITNSNDIKNYERCIYAMLFAISRYYNYKQDEVELCTQWKN